MSKKDADDNEIREFLKMCLCLCVQREESISEESLARIFSSSPLIIRFTYICNFKRLAISFVFRSSPSISTHTCSKRFCSHKPPVKESPRQPPINVSVYQQIGAVRGMKDYT